MKTKRIDGVLCEIETDQNGFVGVTIVEPTQWIVRGAVNMTMAINLARQAINALKARQGHFTSRP
jgi:hypothetical protein